MSLFLKLYHYYHFFVCVYDLGIDVVPRVGAPAGWSLLCGYVGVQLHHIKLNARRHFSVCQGHRFGNEASPSIILSEPI